MMNKQEWLSAAGILIFVAGLAFGMSGPGWLSSGEMPERVAYGGSPGIADGVSAAVMKSGTAEDVPPEVAELARHLEHHPLQIFNFVQNQIDYVPYYGFLKGPLQTLLDRAGNDADQAELLVALLRTSGYTAQYVYGYQYMPTTESLHSAANWFDVSASAEAVDEMIVRNGIPGMADSDWTVMDRVWVEVTISNRTYQLDAAFKPYVRMEGVDLATATGYDRAALLTVAGGEEGAMDVSGVDEVAVKGALDTLSSRLAAYLREKMPNAHFSEVLGGPERTIAAYTNLPEEPIFPYVVTARWPNPPSNLLHTVRIEHGTMDKTYRMSEVAGRRLAISYTNDTTGVGPLSVPSQPLVMALSNGPPELSSPTALAPVTAGTVRMVDAGDGHSPQTWNGVQPKSTHSINLGTVFNLSGYHLITRNLVEYTNPYDMSLQMTISLLDNVGGAISVQGASGQDILQPGASRLVTVQLNGLGRTYGAKSATLRITGKYMQTTVIDDTFYLSGTVAQEPRLDDSYGMDAGATWVGYPVSGFARLCNSGNFNLSISSIQLVGTDAARFELVSGAGSGPLGAGYCRDIGVRYKGNIRGSHTAMIRIAFSYYGFDYEWDYLGLRGYTAYPPNLTGSYGCNFGTNAYQQPLNGVCRLQNAGPLPLSIQSVSLTGSDAGAFQLVGGDGTGTVGAGGTRDITVRYLTASRGRHNAGVQVAYVYDGISYTDTLPLQGCTVSQPVAQLWLDDEWVAQEAVPVAGAGATLRVTVDHPYAANNGAYYDQAVEFSLKRGGHYVLLTDFGRSGNGYLLEHRQRKLDAYRQTGHADTSRPVLLETLNVLGQTWMNQTSRMEDILNALADVRRTYHHRVGVMAQEEGYFVDVKGQYATSIPRATGGDRTRDGWRAAGLLSSALEHGILEQLQGTNRPGVSTAKLLALANREGQAIYRADSNTLTQVRTHLQNYSAYDLAVFEARVAIGQVLILPASADIVVNDWRGGGFAVHGPVADGYNEIGMIIAGGYYGGYSAYTGPVNVVQVASTYQASHTQASETPTVKVADPVDIATGNLLLDQTDLVLGSGRPPSGLSMARHYSSAYNQQPHPLGYGWRHGLDIRAQIRSEGAAGLGRRAPLDAVPWLVASVVVKDLLEHEDTAKSWTVAAIAALWGTEQLNDNAVSIQIGERHMDFIRLPDGTYSAPPGSTAELVRSNSVFVLKERFGIELEFNAQNRVETWRNADGLSAAFQYNAQTNLQQVTDAFGRSLAFSYSGSNLVEVADSTGRAVRYAQSGGNLTAVTDAGGGVWRMGYDAAHRVLWMRDPLDQMTVSNEYDAVSGRVASQWDAFGRKWNFYVVPKYRGVEENPLGEKSVYEFDDLGRQTATIDGMGNRQSAWHDGQNHPWLKQDAKGALSMVVYDGRQNPVEMINEMFFTSTMDYDTENHLIQITDELGGETVFEYDIHHHLVKQTDAIGGIFTFSYNVQGLLERQVDARGGITEWDYDAWGNPIRVTHPDGSVELREWNARGDLLKRVDGLGNETRYTWNERRLCTSESDASGFAASNEYNAAGLLIRSIDREGRATVRGWSPSYKAAFVRHADGAVVSNQYDSADRLSGVRDALGAWSYSRYDAAGRLVEVEDALGRTVTHDYDANGNVVRIRDPLGRETLHRYDALNRQVETTNALGFSTLWNLDALSRETARTDALGFRWETDYDALSRPVLHRKPGGEEERNHYDAAGNRTRFLNAEHAGMDFHFDAMNRVESRTNAVGAVWHTAYDAAGNLIRRTDAEGRDTVFAYDAQNRLTNRLSPDGMTAFTYSPNGNLLSIYKEDVAVEMAYDAMNRPTQSIVRLPNGTAHTIGYAYDLNGRRVETRYPSGAVALETRDAIGQATNLSVSAWGVAAAFAFDANGNLVEQNMGNGVVARFVPDALGRLVEYEAGPSSGAPFLRRTITRNGLGHKTRETLHAGLAPAAPSARQTFAYDAADRMSRESQQTAFAYPEGWTDTAFSYSLNGNMTQSFHTIHGTTVYAWDADNHLTGISNAAIHVALEYDPFGYLIRVEENHAQTFLLRDYADPLKRPLAQLDTDGNTIRCFVWSNGRLVAQVEADGTVRYAHVDELGHLLALSDAAGSLTDQFAYDPHGTVLARTGSTSIPFTWLGAYGVVSLGHDYYSTLHRTYNAGIKRWLSEDPSGLDGGANLYAYAVNPLFAVDPTGLHATEGGYLYDAGQTLLGCGDALTAALSSILSVGNMALTDLDYALSNPGQIPSMVADTMMGMLNGITSMPGNFAATWNSGPRGQGQLLGGALITAAAAAPFAKSASFAKPTPVSAGARGVSTDYGLAIQSSSANAQAALRQVQSGATVYKGGVLGRSETTASQFLSLENPLSPGYAGRHGIPTQNANFDFVLTGQVKPGATVITRPSPGIPPNFGGGIEAVTTPESFRINSFYMP